MKHALRLIQLKIKLIALCVVVVLVLVFVLAGAMTLVFGTAGGAQTDPTPTDCSAPGRPGEIPEAPAEIAAQQLANAKAIDQATEKAGFSGYASRIAIITALGESSLINLDYGDQVNGVTNPDGSPATSFGLFQQQTSQGWGTKEQVMNPEYATTSFLLGAKHDGKGGLSSVLHWEATTYISSVIHQVQRNSNRDHYTQYVAPADAIIAKAGINVSRPAKDGATAPAVTPGDGSASGECGADSGTVDPKDGNNDYPFNDITPGPGVYVIDPFGYYYGECTSFVAWRINRDAGSNSAPFKFSAAKGNFLNGNAATWKEAWLARGWKVSATPVAGAVAWWGANGGVGIGEAGHVAYVQSVTSDGKAVIEEFNNVGLAPPGHKYNMRAHPVEPTEVNMFLYPPPKG